MSNRLRDYSLIEIFTNQVNIYREVPYLGTKWIKFKLNLILKMIGRKPTRIELKLEDDLIELDDLHMQNVRK